MENQAVLSKAFIKQSLKQSRKFLIQFKKGIQAFHGMKLQGVFSSKSKLLKMTKRPIYS